VHEVAARALQLVVVVVTPRAGQMASVTVERQQHIDHIHNTLMRQRPPFAIHEKIKSDMPIKYENIIICTHLADNFGSKYRL
jgi:hypothetical protein